jgi:hypothetical protein
MFSVTDQGARINAYSVYGVERRQIVSPPVGWLLNSSERLVDYEMRYEEDYAVLHDYVSPEHPWNDLFIMLEVAGDSPFLMDDWNLSGWQRMEVEDVLLKEDVVGQSVVLQDTIRNETMAVFYWKTRLLFSSDSDYSIRTVGVSVYVKFNEILSESQVFEIFEEMKDIGQIMVDRWFFIDRLTFHASTLSQIYTQFGVLFRDLFVTAMGVVGLFLVARWIRDRDERNSKLTERAPLLSDKQAQLLLAASKMKQRKFRGIDLFEEYRFLTNEDDLILFYERLQKLLTLELMRRDYVVDRAGELRMVWVMNLP